MNLAELQMLIKSKDHDPDNIQGYFLKLIEEVGELAEAIRTDKPPIDSNIKNTIGEELYDVMYYVCCLANVYDIDLEKVHKLKSQLNAKKYPSP